MLKLTNSFYRYIWFECEKVDKADVRRYLHLYCAGKTCGAVRTDTVVAAQFHTGAQSHEHHGRGNKRLRIKIPSLINHANIRKPMTTPSQPTSTLVSHGGKFNVGDDDDDPYEEKRRQSQAASSEGTTWGPFRGPANFRVWETVGKRSSNRDVSTFQFRVVSYNVLAQYLLESHPYIYTECTPRNLKWKVRAARLYDEIISYSPDILCLQEVQASHLYTFYSKFEEIGYYGIFKQKTGHRQDGCAIYFKKSLFEIIDHLNVEFYQPDLPLLNRDNIGMMVKLRPRALPDSPLVVATTHLLYNPKRTDVRLAQMQVLLAEIDRFAYYNNGRESGHVPIILTGDFNSMPDSVVIKLLDRGHINASSYRDNSDFKRIGVTDNCQHLSVYLNRREGRGTDFSDVKIFNTEYCESSCPEELRAVGRSAAAAAEKFRDLFNTGVLGHALRLASVYDTCKPDGAYEATTHQDYWLTVDYMYFSYCSTLKLVERLRMPTADECESLGRLPNDRYGSDHLALAAVFELRPYKAAL